MVLRGVLKWIGICGIGLFLGLFAILLSQEIVKLLVIPDKPDQDYNSEVSYYLLKQYIGSICFAWAMLACLFITGLRRTRFHLLFGQGLALLLFSLYLTFKTYFILNIVAAAAWGRKFRDFWEYKQVGAYELVGVSAFLIMASLLILMFSLIADKSEQERQRAWRRQKRFLH